MGGTWSAPAGRDGTTWSAPVHSTFGTGTSGSGPDSFYQTDVTANHTVARRNFGTGWTPAVDLGPAGSLVFALDPSDSPVAVVSLATGSLGVRRCAADGTTWDGPVPTGFASSTSNAMYMMTLAFDAAGHPVIADADVVQTAPTQLIRLTVCE